MPDRNRLWVIVRGGGDLTSGVVLRLQRAGLLALVLEISQPLVVRRRVAFAEAVYQGRARVEEFEAVRVDDLSQAWQAAGEGLVPVLVDPQAASLEGLRRMLLPGVPLVVVDGRMTKLPPEQPCPQADLSIGLGPGFVAGESCHAVVETQRGPWLGRVIWQGMAAADTGLPEAVAGASAERVLRAPVDGVLQTYCEIGDRLMAGQLVARVGEQPLLSSLDGVLRGLLHPGLMVQRGMKVGDVDPRGDPRACVMVSDKALAIGGSVMEAILARPELRPYLWGDNV